MFTPRFFLASVSCARGSSLFSPTRFSLNTEGCLMGSGHSSRFDLILGVIFRPTSICIYSIHDYIFFRHGMLVYGESRRGSPKNMIMSTRGGVKLPIAHAVVPHLLPVLPSLLPFGLVRRGRSHACSLWKVATSRRSRKSLAAASLARWPR